MADLKPGVHDRQLHACPVAGVRDGRSHPQIGARDAGPLAETRLPRVLEMPLLGEQRIGACGARGGAQARHAAARDDPAVFVGGEAEVHGRLGIRPQAFDIGPEVIAAIGRQVPEREAELMDFEEREHLAVGRDQPRTVQPVDVGCEIRIARPFRDQPERLSIGHPGEGRHRQVNRGLRHAVADQHQKPPVLLYAQFLVQGGRLPVEQRDRDGRSRSGLRMAGNRIDRDRDALVALLVKIPIHVHRHGSRKGIGSQHHGIAADRVVVAARGRAGQAQRHGGAGMRRGCGLNHHLHHGIVRFGHFRRRGREQRHGDRRRGRLAAAAPAGAKRQDAGQRGGQARSYFHCGLLR